MAAEIRPFGKDAPRVWTIPPGTDFLGSLARVLADTFKLRERADALADAIIYVPNRRSARALTLALFDTLGGAGTLLPPDIRTLGDLESDEPPPVTETALAGLPPALSPAARLGVLAKLAAIFYAREYGHTLPPASALASARELSRLLEQASMGEASVDWSQLTGLVTEADLAVHWKDSTEFLSIITEMWPQWLRENNAGDPFERRQQAAEALVASWDAKPPIAPVIIAGSTGATPSGRLLMQAVTQLPKGLVVLPGLDTDLSEKSLAAVSGAPSHPQFVLVRTLKTLGISLGDVAEWPAAPGEARSPSRRAQPPTRCSMVSSTTAHRIRWRWRRAFCRGLPTTNCRAKFAARCQDSVAPTESGCDFDWLAAHPTLADETDRRSKPTDPLGPA